MINNHKILKIIQQITIKTYNKLSNHRYKKEIYKIIKFKYPILKLRY